MIVTIVMSVLLLSHATMDTVKTQFLEKNVVEAVFLLKNDHQKILKSTHHKQQAAQWLEMFQYDSTLGLYEKGVEQLLDSDYLGSEKNFLLALEREPYNTKILTQVIALWINQGNLGKARDKILWAQQELPFIEMFKLYSVWLDLKETGESKHKINCLEATLFPPEKDFCHYVHLQQLTLSSKARKAGAEVMKAFQKTTIPNKHIVMWQKWKNADEKQKYLSSCRTLSDKQKKAFLIVPEFCKYEDKVPND